MTPDELTSATTKRVDAFPPNAASALCAKHTTNMNHHQWNAWASPDIDYVPVCPDPPPAR